MTQPNVDPATLAAQLQAAGINATTTKPAGYYIEIAPGVYTSDLSTGDKSGRDGFSSSQWDLMTTLSDPYLAQSYKDAAIANYSTMGNSSAGGAGNPAAAGAPGAAQQFVATSRLGPTGHPVDYAWLQGAGYITQNAAGQWVTTSKMGVAGHPVDYQWLQSAGFIAPAAGTSGGAGGAPGSPGSAGGAGGSGGGAGPGGSTGTQMSAADQSAKAMIDDMLAQYGLGALGSWAWNEYLNGIPVDKIMSDMRKTDTYKQRFPGMAELAAKGQAISEADYIAKERADYELMRAYGVPDQMAQDRNELGKLIGSQVSTAELQQRLDDYKNVVYQLPESTRTYLQREFGISSGDLLGFWLNPDVALPVLQNKYQASLIGGVAADSGFGALDKNTALRLAGLGVSDAQARQGFAQIGQMGQLTQTLPGEAQNGVSKDTLVNAALAGDANAQQAVSRIQGQRKAMFDQNLGGEAQSSTQGVVGLRSANSAF